MEYGILLLTALLLAALLLISPSTLCRAAETGKPSDLTPKYLVTAPEIAVYLDANGEITG
jgi:hypothetical protein